LGRISASYDPQDKKLERLLEKLKKLARDERAMGPAAVDGIALCGMSRPVVLKALREIAEGRLIQYSDLTRLRVVEWWPAEQIRALGVKDSLEWMLRPVNNERIRLAAAHALVVAGLRTNSVREILDELSGPTFEGAVRDHARLLLARQRTESRFPFSAGPSISEVCTRVARASGS
jgi:hypothetical protein